MFVWRRYQKNRRKSFRFAALKVSPNTYNHTNGITYTYTVQAFTSYLVATCWIIFGEILRALTVRVNTLSQYVFLRRAKRQSRLLSSSVFVLRHSNYLYYLLNINICFYSQNTSSAIFLVAIICHPFYCTEPNTPLCSSSIGKYRLRLLPHAILPISSI